MPELPEVETIRQDLRRKIIGCTIMGATLNSDKVAGGQAARQKLARFLPGKKIAEVGRVGKLLIIEIGQSDYFLLVHLKMTGQLIYTQKGKTIGGGHSFTTLSTELPDKHTLVILSFENEGKLFFNDMRRFGYVKLVDRVAKEKVVEAFGIEPLTEGFTFEKFSALFKKRKTLLKALLLNQQVIAGIGNIYADEICHAAGILPTRRISTLTHAEIKKLFTTTEKIIKKAIEFRGTTFNNYVDSDGNKGNFSRLLKVYERSGEKCLTCRVDSIKKIKAAGRGTHFCTTCQK